jgi:benzoylformate decarboxylase
VMHRHLPMLQSETFYTMCSGGLGHSMPAAVGVALARRDAGSAERVIALIGDGSAMYSIQALWSAVQLRLPITFIILNNRRYAALREFAAVFGYRPDDPVAGTDLPGIDFVQLAAGQGLRGQHVRDADTLHAALSSALQSAEPVLLDVEVN